MGCLFYCYFELRIIPPAQDTSTAEYQLRIFLAFTSSQPLSGQLKREENTELFMMTLDFFMTQTRKCSASRWLGLEGHSQNDTICRNNNDTLIL
jgi:hypothetical protein